MRSNAFHYIIYQQMVGLMHYRHVLVPVHFCFCYFLRLAVVQRVLFVPIALELETWEHSSVRFQHRAVTEFLAVEDTVFIEIHRHMQAINNVFSVSGLKPLKTVRPLRKWLKVQDVIVKGCADCLDEYPLAYLRVRFIVRS